MKKRFSEFEIIFFKDPITQIVRISTREYIPLGVRVRNKQMPQCLTTVTHNDLLHTMNDRFSMAFNRECTEIKEMLSTWHEKLYY